MGKAKRGRKTEDKSKKGEREKSTNGGIKKKHTVRRPSSLLPIRSPPSLLPSLLKYTPEDKEEKGDAKEKKEKGITRERDRIEDIGKYWSVPVSPLFSRIAALLLPDDVAPSSHPLISTWIERPSFEEHMISRTGRRIRKDGPGAVCWYSAPQETNNSDHRSTDADLSREPPISGFADRFATHARRLNTNF